MLRNFPSGWKGLGNLVTDVCQSLPPVVRVCPPVTASLLAASVKVLPPPDREGLIMGAPPVIARGRR